MNNVYKLGMNNLYESVDTMSFRKLIVSYASSSYKSLIVRPVLPHKLPNNIREDICWYSKNLKTEWRQCLMSSIPSRNKTFFSIPT